jgi:hypothetical protein
MRRKTVASGEGGYILFVALGFAVLLGLGSVLAVTGTIAELQSAGRQLRDKRAFFLADGGANLCLHELRNRLQRDLAGQLRILPDIQSVGDYVSNNDPAGFLATYAYEPGTSLGDAFQRVNASEARLPLSYTAAGAPGPYTCTLAVLSRTAPVNRGTAMSPVYLFRYHYAIDGSATEGEITRRVNLQGTFSVQVEMENFARYALFTNQQRDAAGLPIWFTNRTNFSGPVHTNGEFNFALNPGGLFTGPVTSVSSTATYYNGGAPVQLNADRNGDRDVPTFEAGFERGVPNIPMPTTTTAERQREAALGLPGGSGIPAHPTGVYLGSSGGAMTGGIYIKGDAAMTLGAGATTATYTITQGGSTTTVTVNQAANQTILQVGSAPPTVYSGVPNGMIFVDGGTLSSLSGTVQRDSRVTVATTGDIQITNNITYQDYTPGSVPSAEGTTNVLGILSWSGNVRIGATAPNDINVHATVMTPNGEFRVDNYTTGPFRGTATILGGVIENTYGAFGTVGTIKTGYLRTFVYDTRMGRGVAPPFFPTTGKMVITLPGVNDRPNWQQTS